MAVLERSGHWRTLSDGTRTWVSGHRVIREKTSTDRHDADQVFKANNVVTAKKVNIRKGKKTPDQVARKAEARLVERQRQKLVKSNRAKKLRIQRKAAEAAAKHAIKEKVVASRRKLSLEAARLQALETSKKRGN